MKCNPKDEAIDKARNQQLLTWKDAALVVGLSLALTSAAILWNRTHTPAVVPDGTVPSARSSGFTLIELSIVLVIIGLIVGGVLVGQDLIRAAAVRATISQIEKFNLAVNTFFGKYGYLPGDMPATPASQFGFSARGAIAGEGDGNGVIQGAGGCGWGEDAGETVMFWSDLTYANGMNLNLIEGTFNLASETSNAMGLVTGAALNNVLPPAKLGGSYFFVWSNTCPGPVNGEAAANYYGLSRVTNIYPNNINGCFQCITSSPGLRVKDAYDIDRKIDDGLPFSGRVVAQYLDAGTFGSSGYGDAPTAVSASSTTCFDTTSGTYSVAVNGGAGVNCALSIQIQGGD